MTDEPEPMEPVLPWQQWVIANALEAALKSGPGGIYRTEILCIREEREQS